MTCPHDIIEKGNACADGMCPICLARTAEYLREKLQAERLRTVNWCDQIAKLEQRITTLEGMLGEANMAVPE